MKQNNIKKRGFASMDPEMRREVARRGGKASHERGTAHEFTPEEAREAGRKGGLHKEMGKEDTFLDQDEYT